MIKFNIPGHGDYSLEHLVMDVNGTLAVDRQLIDGVAEKIASLRDEVTIHLLTADTHGRQAVIDQQLGLTAIRITPGNESSQKADYVRRLGREKVAAIGQGANDCSAHWHRTPVRCSKSRAVPGDIAALAGHVGQLVLIGLE
jgi:soluble P-type ATPase